MAGMIVKNNMPAIYGLNTLSKNRKELAQNLQKVSTGMRINGAADDASSYAISERMRVQIRGLQQDTLNVKNGIFLIRVASGGVENIIEELRTLKEMALDAANDHNSDLDRATLQRSFDQKIANIDDIALDTNYNGKILLDGTYSRYRTIGIAMDEPAGAVQTISGSSITTDGIYILPSGFTGTVTVSSSAKNVEIRQANPNEVLHDVYINGPAGGNANIWINGLNVENQSDGSIIKFQGSDNYLTLVGNNKINYTSTTVDYNKAVINIGDGLTIGGTGRLSIRNTGVMSCAGIGVDQDQYTTGSLVINGGIYDIYINNDGAGIGASLHSATGDIVINGGTIHAVSKTGAGIGSTGYPMDGVRTRTANSRAGNIVIGRNAIVDVESIYGAGIGSGANGAYANSIKISGGADIRAYSEYGEDIGRGWRGIVGSVDIDWDDGNIQYYTYRWDKQNPLIIHHGTKANQTLRCYIGDMRTKSMGIDYASVITREDASDAISIVNVAIEYVLDEATSLGAYLSRLESTEDNLVTSEENTQSAESTLRDMDMAKAMTEYTKSNLLAQASQSMLAQANQNSSDVLSLLQ